MQRGAEKNGTKHKTRLHFLYNMPMAFPLFFDKMHWNSHKNSRIVLQWRGKSENRAFT